MPVLLRVGRFFARFKVQQNMQMGGGIYPNQTSNSSFTDDFKGNLSARIPRRQASGLCRNGHFRCTPGKRTTVAPSNPPQIPFSVPYQTSIERGSRHIIGRQCQGSGRSTGRSTVPTSFRRGSASDAAAAASPQSAITSTRSRRMISAITAMSVSTAPGNTSPQRFPTTFTSPKGSMSSRVRSESAVARNP